jgi:hypothetical protein
MSENYHADYSGKSSNWTMDLQGLKKKAITQEDIDDLKIALYTSKSSRELFQKLGIES